MGAALLALFMLVAALVWLRPNTPEEPPTYERTLLWFYDRANPSGTGFAAILEEDRQKGRLTAVAFLTPAEVQEMFGSGSSARKVQQQIASTVNRQIHHRFFVSYQAIEVLVKAAGGIAVDGRQMDGPASTAYLRENPGQDPDRGLRLMQALAEAMNRQFALSVREGMGLAGEVDTDLDFAQVPDVLSRWHGYEQPVMGQVGQLNEEAVRSFLHPDPEP